MEKNKVFKLSVKGFSQSDIIKILNIPKSNISRDLLYLRQKSNENITRHIQELLHYEYNKCIQGLEEIMKGSWLIAAKADKEGSDREKLSSLALIKDAYSTKLDLLTNASLLKDSSILYKNLKKN